MQSIESRLERYLRENLRLYEFMDVSVESASDGIYRCRVPLSAKTQNHFHTIHAALQWATAELLGGLVWNVIRPRDGDYVPVVRRFEIDFKRPAYGDVIAETRVSEARGESMRAEIAEKGLLDFELESELRTLEGVTVAKALGFYAVRSASTMAKR